VSVACGVVPRVTRLDPLRRVLSFPDFVSGDACYLRPAPFAAVIAKLTASFTPIPA
jgi:hypothetical protein